MTDQAERKYALVDVRHTTSSENVACMSSLCKSRWAKYVVSTDFDPRSMMRKPVKTYLCQKCLTELLLLAEGIGVG